MGNPMHSHFSLYVALNKIRDIFRNIYISLTFPTILQRRPALVRVVFFRPVTKLQSWLLQIYVLDIKTADGPHSDPELLNQLILHVTA